MFEPIRALDPSSIITGWDFSTGSVKCMAFDLNGHTIAEVRLPTDVWAKGAVRELSLTQLEGQAHATVRELAVKLRHAGRLEHWVAGGISATHHTSGRINEYHNPVRRAICWNDGTLPKFHQKGLDRLGGKERVRTLIGGPWRDRYSLTHLVKDETALKKPEWKSTFRILSHASLAAGYLTGNFDMSSISSAASTGMFNLRTNEWCWEMLDALKTVGNRELVKRQMPRIITDPNEPVGTLAHHLALEAGLGEGHRPAIYPPSDDQAAGLIGGGAIEPGQMAIILGNSAVVNSASDHLASTGDLDLMKLNSGQNLWMRCFSNGAQFLDGIVGKKPDWSQLEEAGRQVPPGCNDVAVMPFALAETAYHIMKPAIRWHGPATREIGVRYRASLESIAFLIAMGVEEHAAAGQSAAEVTVSGGIARSDLMCEILASVLGRSLKRLQSDEGPALGAAVTALAAAETNARRERNISEPYSIRDAIHALVKYREPVASNPEWSERYQGLFNQFKERVLELRAVDASA